MNTPFGNPGAMREFGNARAPTAAFRCAGLITKVQPAASAGAHLRVIIALGKFHGVIAATTPMGSFSTMMRRPAALVGITSP